MKNLLTTTLNLFAFGLICFVSVIVLRPTSSADVISTSTELPASVEATFNKELGEAIAESQRVQLNSLAEQLKILQKIDTNVNRLIGSPNSTEPIAPKLVEDKNCEAMEIAPSFPITTSRGLFRRGSTIRQPISSPSK